MLADSLVENTITHFLHYLQKSACFLHQVTGLCRELYFGWNLKGGWVKWKSNLWKYSVHFFPPRLLPGLHRVKASISTFYPLTFELEIWVKVTKNRRIFFFATKGVPIIIESSTDKNIRKTSERFKFAM